MDRAASRTVEPVHGDGPSPGGPATAGPLDGALARVSALEHPPPARFVSHAPMACEALDALGLGDAIEQWVPRFEGVLVVGAAAAEPGEVGGDGWAGQLGDRRLLPEWLGYFDRALADEGWPTLVRTWVPRLVPGLSSALFHGVIRTAHAVRAVAAADTPPRQGELARALASWATWWHPGEPATERPASDPAAAVLAAAASGARHYAVEPTIVHLHGVTGAMALHLLLDRLDEASAAEAAARLDAEHRALYGRPAAADVRVDRAQDSAVDAAVDAAARSGDPHQVKLVEACRRGFRLTGQGTFVAAAATVTGTG